MMLLVAHVFFERLKDELFRISAHRCSHLNITPGWIAPGGSSENLSANPDVKQFIGIVQPSHGHADERNFDYIGNSALNFPAVIKRRKHMKTRMFFELFCCSAVLALTYVVISPSGAYSAELPITDGLVAYWGFEEGTGTETADMSGNGHDATFSGQPEWVDGKVGKALRFQGSAMVEAPNHAQLKITKEITIAHWMKRENPINAGELDRIVCKGDREYTTFMSSGHPGEVGLFSQAWRGGEVISGDKVPVGVWLHVAFVRTGSPGTGSCYFNGAKSSFSNLKASNLKSDMYTANGNLFIGTQNGSAKKSFGGILDEVCIFDRTLSDDEVKALYEYTGSDVTSTSMPMHVRIQSETSKQPGDKTFHGFDLLGRPYMNIPTWHRVYLLYDRETRSAKTITLFKGPSLQHGQ